MIEFENRLPRLKMGYERVGTYNNVEVGFPSITTTTDPKLGMFIKDLRSSILSERALLFVDGKILMVNKNWIRDHVHTMKAMKHFEYNLDSFLNFIIDTQREDGQFFELIKQWDDAHQKFVNEDCLIRYPEDNVYLERLECEADIEYLVVEGAMYLYRTTGDNEWLEKVLPKLEKGIDYITSDEKRWDKEYGLVKRPFTIDTWDFEYNRPGWDRRIAEDSLMSIMHGDNSGVYQAMNQLAWFNRRLGNEEKALMWEKRAEELKENMFKHLWNGKFFIHQLHLGHNGADNLESERLSLSNSYDMNRGVTDVAQARSIIEEYIQRGKKTHLFAEWFTIDPPYEKFGNHTPGSYVNGAVSPFTAGELCKAAFNNGYEEYGWDILQRFMKIIERDGKAYFLYYPDSAPQPELGPCAWGAAALISAVDEGLAGIFDKGVKYDEIYFAPRFPVTYYKELRYITGYEVSGTKVDVRYIIKDEGMRYDVYSPANKIDCHIYIPKDKTVKKVIVDNKEVEFNHTKTGESVYADFEVSPKGSKVSMELIW